MSDYPVQVETTSPEHHERIQLLLRVAFALVLGWIGITGGKLVWLLYLTLPMLAAIAVSAIGSDRYGNELAPRLWRAISWLLRLSAYMMFLTDRFPTGQDRNVRLDILFTGQPRIGSALVRLVTSIPSAIVLGLLWCVSSFIWLIAALFVLVAARVPHWYLAFQRGVLRWQARLLAYHASFVDEYPPFSFDTEDRHPAAQPAAA